MRRFGCRPFADANVRTAALSAAAFALSDALGRSIEKALVLDPVRGSSGPCVSAKMAETLPRRPH